MSDYSEDSELNEPLMDDMIVDFIKSSPREPVMSNEQLCSKINTFRKMCSSNKINSNNAFDLHMTEYFHKWLKKKSKEGKLNQENLFVDMSDYLDTTGKIYSCRIDSVNTSIKSLYEKVKMDGLIKIHRNHLLDNDTNDTNIKKQPEVKHNKRSRVMITTGDKLRGIPIESHTQFETPFDLRELTKVGRPSEYFLARFNNTTFTAQFQKDMDNLKKVVKSNDKFTMKNISKQIQAGEICPEFSGFLSKRHMLLCDKDLNLDSLEDCYDPNDDPQNNCTISNETSMDIDNCDELGTSLTVEEKVEQFKGLVNCVDGGKSEYSYFNPTLLVNWPGPKAWKAHTLQKSLRHRGERSKEPISYLEDFDDDVPKLNKLKSSYKRRKLIENKNLVNWLDTKEINNMFKTMMKGNEQISKQTLKRWTSLNNAVDPPPFKMKHKFTFLEYLEIKPDWLIQSTDQEERTNEEENSPENFPLDDYQDNDEYCHPENARIEVENIPQKPNDNDNDDDEDEDKDEDEDDDLLPKESKLDVTELKTEILNIINQESPSNNGNHAGIPFCKLLQKLNAFEREISMALIYVAILHLNNERRLKMLNADNSGDMSKVCIAKLTKP